VESAWTGASGQARTFKVASEASCVAVAPPAGRPSETRGAIVAALPEPSDLTVPDDLLEERRTGDLNNPGAPDPHVGAALQLSLT
jgi:hypothetical protein